MMRRITTSMQRRRWLGDRICFPAGYAAMTALLVGFTWSGPLSLRASSGLPAAPSQQSGTIKVDVDYVQVDVSVTNRQGQFVRGLERDAFEVYEDGKRQPVSAFSLVDLPLPSPRRTATAAGVMRHVEPDVQSSEALSAGRVYVIVLDDLHVDPLRSARVKEAAREFIDRHLGPNDLAAVLHTSGRKDANQEFTSRPALLLQAVDRFVGRKMRSSMLDRLDEYERTRGRSSRADIRLNRIADPLDAQRADQARRMLTTLTSLGDLLSDTGARRKAVLLFSEGIDYPLQESTTQTRSGLTTFTSPFAADVIRGLQQVVRAAARANVSIYTIDPRGLSGAGDEMIQVSSLPDNPHLGLTPTAFEDEVRRAKDSLRLVAEQTGGIAAVTVNEFADAFDRIVRDSGTYYMLGYRSSNPRQDGTFRRIEVRVARNDVHVRARSGYVAVRPGKARPQLLASDGEPSAALRDVLNTPLPGGALALRVFAAAFRGDKAASVSVGVEIDARTFRFVEKQGLFVGKVEVALVAFDQSGKFKTGDRQAVMLQLKPDTHRAVQTHGIRVLFRLNLPAGRFQLRAAVHEPDTGATGSVFHDIEVPDFAAGVLGMSGMILASTRAAQMPTARTDAIFEKALPSPPTGLRTFRSDETLIALTEVYGPPDVTRAGVNLLTTVHGADGRRRFSATEQVSSQDRAAQEGAFGYVVNVPLVSLPPGSYILKMEARAGSGGAVAFREIPFDVIAPEGQAIAVHGRLPPPRSGR